MGRCRKYIGTPPNVTQELEIQEELWEDVSFDEEQDKTFVDKAESFEQRVDRILKTQDQIFKEQTGENKPVEEPRHLRTKYREITTSEVPYLEADIPGVELEKRGGEWEARVELSGQGGTASLALRDLLLETIRLMEDLV